MKTITVNRRARHEYDILESFEGGLVLTGTEIKSIRDGRVNIRDAFGRPEDGELWLCNAHISPYSNGNRENHEPMRPRKVLMHRNQIDYLSSKVQEKGLTLVPLKLYIKNHKAKVELGVARGRKLYDKRAVIARRDADRQMQRAILKEATVRRN